MSDAAAAAVALGRALGLRVERTELLAERSNALVALEPAGVVARVATVTAAAGRDVRAALGREVALAAALAGAGAPVLPPWDDAGPYERDGFAITLWPRLRDVRPAEPAPAGRALRECHAALDAIAPVDLPALWLLDEAAALARDDGVRKLLGDDAGWVVDELGAARARLTDCSVVPVHGDAGLGNALETGGRVLWTDWEDAMLAPRMWDAACLASTPLIFGEPGRARAALAGLGVDAEDPALAALVRVRALQVVAWSAFAVAGGAGRARLDARLAWLRVPAPSNVNGLR